MEHLGNYIFRADPPRIKCLRKPETAPRQNAGTIEAFIQYPSTVGWEQRNGRWILTNPQESQSSPHDMDSSLEFNIMMQRWLYFELLSSFLSDAQFPYHHYYHSSPGETDAFITTSKLNDRIARWAECMHTEVTDPHKRVLQAQHVLVMARAEVARACTANDGPSSRQSQLPIQPEIALSLIVLGETLTRALLDLETTHKSLHQPGWRHEVLKCQGWGTSTWVLEKLHNLWDVRPERGCKELSAMQRTFSGEWKSIYSFYFES